MKKNFLTVMVCMSMFSTQSFCVEAKESENQKQLQVCPEGTTPKVVLISAKDRWGNIVPHWSYWQTYCDVTEEAASTEQVPNQNVSAEAIP